MMTVILDNLIFSLQKAGGISTVWAVHIRNLLRVPGIECYFLEYPGAENNVCRKELLLSPHRLLRHNVNMPTAYIRLINPTVKNVHTEDGTPLSEVLKSGVAIFHSSYYRCMQGKNVKNIVTSHDMILERMHAYPGLRGYMHMYLKRQAIRKADAIACVSNSTLNDLQHYYPKMAHKATVVHNGVDLPPEKATSSGDYLLYIGSREKYKNFNKAVDFARSYGLPLHICGEALTTLEREMLTGVDFEESIYPDNTALAEQLSNAEALVYPSSYEGFGLPIIEAQNIGCPVILSRELNCAYIAGDGALFIDCGDASEIELIRQQLSDPTSREKIVEKGRINAAKYSSQNMTNRYINLYGEILK